MKPGQHELTPHGYNAGLYDQDDYVFLVPFIETGDEIFLKTIIPSRKATRQYLGDSND